MLVADNLRAWNILRGLALAWLVPVIGLFVLLLQCGPGGGLDSRLCEALFASRRLLVLGLELSGAAIAIPMLIVGYRISHPS